MAKKSKVVEPSGYNDESEAIQNLSETTQVQESEKILNPGSHTRVFSKSQEIVVDLYKLLAAYVIKRTGVAFHPEVDRNDFTDFAHEHFFRTYDSDGKQHTYCTPVAGHSHEVILEPSEIPGEAPKIVKIGPPIKFANKVVHGKKKKVAIPLNDYDFHTHKPQYLNSHKANARVRNAEAQVLIAQDAQKYATVSGTAPATSDRTSVMMSQNPNRRDR